MDRQVVQLIAVTAGALLIFVGIWYFQNRRIGGRTKARKAIAEAHGWTYTENEEGTLWRYQGTWHGVAFVADSQKPRQDLPASGDIRPNRTWLKARVSDAGGLLVAPKVLGGVTAGVAARALAVVAGPAVPALQQDGFPVLQPEPFSKQFDVRETEEGTADRILTDDVRRALLEQAARKSGALPMITLYHGELHVLIGVELYNADSVEGFLDRALTVLDTVSGAGS